MTEWLSVPPPTLAEWLSGCFDFSSRVAHPLYFSTFPTPQIIGKT